MRAVVVFLLSFCLLSAVVARPGWPNSYKSGYVNKVAHDNVHMGNQLVAGGSSKQPTEIDVPKQWYNCPKPVGGISGSLHDDIIRPHPRDRNGMLNARRWPGGRIPYRISPEYNEAEQLMIQNATAEFTRLTDACIRLEPHLESDVNFVEFSADGTGCSSYLGMVGNGAQRINLTRTDCMYHGTILHEIMHAVGFDHEHKRPDRDDFVIIHNENIQPGLHFAFEKLNWTVAGTYNESYDFSSVMHYPPCSFNVNVNPTITPKDGVYREFGNVQSLSESDVRRIKRMYGCPL